MNLFRKSSKSSQKLTLITIISNEYPDLAKLPADERIEKFVELSLNEYMAALGKYMGLPDHYLSGGEPIGEKPVFSQLFSQVMDYQAVERPGFYLLLTHIIGAESQIFRTDLDRLYKQNQIAQQQVDLVMKISEKSVEVERENEGIKDFNNRIN